MTSGAAVIDVLATTPNDLVVGAGFTNARVSAVEAGDFFRFGRGVYELTATLDTDLLDYAVAMAGGRGVVCFMSA